MTTTEAPPSAKPVPEHVRQFIGTLFASEDVVGVRPIETYRIGKRVKTHVTWGHAKGWLARALLEKPVWNRYLEGQGPGGAYVIALSEDRRATLRQRLRERVLRGRPDGAFALEAKAWAVRGIVPDR